MHTRATCRQKRKKRNNEAIFGQKKNYGDNLGLGPDLINLCFHGAEKNQNAQKVYQASAKLKYIFIKI